MTSIKAKLIEAIETVPDSILEQTLDYLEYLKTKEQKPQTLSQEIPQKEGEPILRGSKAKDLLKFAKTWQGDDFEECLQLVYDTRSQAEF
ncbi:hypothetical protein ACN23B_17460 [Anabaena sp. FACHB-709]|uniref:DUF2281 domain-containing protein n=2 Tax=Nostocaceae TaxID=1162 RepID=A0A1Z4KJE2_ANAVA|nr:MULTISPECIES: hypothetical protein [Nostocaceae]BAY69105.1 hypothetical protein NIES23_18960 [Trichormus variabilis NIES-23]HBW32978.1 hypothetical protein [Nostoc sp. UBA8866]MBD2174297.1 hypothetical protein [Anabaena cylindrica FACHB-318]MBD2263597.1 hypothetical protein [Anabaena sp. FACHB-709]MBD2275887.1 hypothetical protein [Nostoc sp. PCC 7120 = FACHB-418]